MEELLEKIIFQNEQMLELLERVVDKLDSLDVLDDIKYSLSTIEKELQWTDKLSSSGQILNAIDELTKAVGSMS